MEKQHTYFVVAKFSSRSAVSSASAELAIAEALKGLGENVKPDIVQIGEL
jgi:hypothetical protein